ncbi:MAG: exonuclease subunit SbcD [Spirochaetales bacterium]|nr:exonuclease subunit SbcD [Spirochaetales bacterium]
MKILHTSDWHLGKKLGTFSRISEQRAVLDELIELCIVQSPDLILISGDLFDAFNPPNEAVELLYRSLKRLTRGGSCPVVALAGNHDSPERVEAPDPLARECGIFFLGYPDSLPGSVSLDSGVEADFPAPGLLELRFPHLKAPARIIYAPYANESRLRKYLGESDRDEALRRILQDSWNSLADEFCTDESVNLFAGHFFMGKRDELFQDEQEPEGERPILFPGGLEMIYTDNLPRTIQYAALGHLHRYQMVAKTPIPVCYSGSPLAYSLSEAGQTKGVVMVEVEQGKKASYEFFPLKSGKPLLRKVFNGVEKLKSWLSENPGCYVEVTLKTDDYISGSVKQELLEMHDGILAIIPQVEQGVDDSSSGRQVDLGRSVEELFTDYFTEQTGGTPPDGELLTLFREIVSSGGEE